MSSLRSDATRAVLARIHAVGEAHDVPARQRFRALRDERAERFSPEEAAELYREAPLAVLPEVGELLYMLVMAGRPACIVEFGTSLGASTIHLAAGLRDSASGGHLIATELHPEKARRAMQNLTDAGLEDLVELRVGDARETLRDLSDPVDLLFLDGFGDLSLSVLRLVEPRLRPGAIVAVDLSAGDPHWPEYRAYVHDAASGYESVNLPLAAGIELSARLGR